MKIIYIKNQKENFLKELEDIKLNNNINDRFKVYQYLRKSLKSKIQDFYLFYDKNNILNCFIEFKTYNPDDNFTQYNLNNKILKDYFKYKEAIKLAKIYHKNQKYGGFLPYMFHLKKIDKVIDHYFFNIPEDKIFIYKISAILHDIVEDTDYKIEDIEKKFGSYVKTIVFNVTKLDKKKTDEYERAYYNKVASDIGSIYVKLADKIINAKQTLKDKSPKHIKNMVKGHPIFQECIYNKIDNKDITNHLDKIMEKLKLLQ